MEYWNIGVNRECYAAFVSHFHHSSTPVLRYSCRFVRVKLVSCFLATYIAYAIPAFSHVEEQSYSCILHVHSKISSYGRYSLSELTDVARSYGVNVIFLSDNLTDTIQYGITPLRHILRLNYSRRSVTTLGPQAYLDQIESENRRQSDVLYVPGVEVCPRFYWTGSLTDGDLVCHNHQRNLIVLGVNDAKVLKKIPEVCGYVWQKNPGYMVSSRVLLVLLLVACLGMVVMPRFLAHRSPYSARQIRQSFVLGIILPLLVIIIAVNIAASLVPLFRIYGQDNSGRCEQRAIDFLKQHNLVHYWAHPEAADDHQFSDVPIHKLKYVPFKTLKIPFKAHTDPYPELLSLTKGYTGFGGVYEAENTLINPGSMWDEVLKQYVNGRRDAPVWCFGEMLYHYEGQAGKKLGNVETIVWAPEKSAEALLEALRKGRFYARENSDGRSLVLEEWKVKQAFPAEIILRVSSRIPGEEIRIQLIRNGQLIKEISGKTPVEFKFADDTRPRSGTVYYRVVVFGHDPLKLVTNPVFISTGTR